MSRREGADPARVARQHIRTSRLLGLDFIPVAEGSRPPAPSSVPPPPAPGQLTLAAATDPPPEIAAEAKGIALEDVSRRHDAECPHCTTATAHTRSVFGEGDPDAEVMFVGEAPGEEEDRTGRPFVGRAGRKLDEMIQAMGLARADVYIANVLKSRPPGNRSPLPTEVDACSPFLAEQIQVIRPTVIVALGGPAAKFLLGTGEGITRIRGRWASYVDGAITIPVMPTFHPAYLLRNYTLDTRTKVWSDLRAVMDRLGLSLQKSGSTPFDPE